MSFSDVIIICDNKMRDGPATELIHQRLLEKGVSSVVCNKLTMFGMVRLLKPKVVVIPYAYGSYSKLMDVADPKCKFLIHPTEGAVPEEDFGGLRVIKPDRFDRIEAYLLWGDKQKWLLGNSGWFPKDRIFVTSTPRYEYYFERFFKKINLDPTSSAKQGEKPLPVGIATSGVEMINPYNRSSIVDRIYRRRNQKDSHYYDLSAGRNIEDNLWFSMSSVRTAYDMIDRLAEEKFSINFRPGPFEDCEPYENIYKNHSLVELDLGSYLWKWLSGLSFTILGRTTIGIESILLGKPVLYFLSLIPRLKDHIDLASISKEPCTEFYYKPNTLEEMVELCKLARQGKLEVTPKKQEYLKYLEDYYQLPRSEPPSLSVANKISEYL